MTYGGSKITTRHRWTPTPVQLQNLERVFEEGIGTPSKQKIKELTAELSQHGPISETNVYNWFQNRRARSKRKQFAEAPNNPEPEFEAESESSEKTIAKDAYSQDPGSHSLDTQPGKGKSSFTSGHYTKPYGSHGQLHYTRMLQLCYCIFKVLNILNCLFGCSLCFQEATS